MVGLCVQIRDAIALIQRSLEGIYQLAAGGTVVGTGLNAPPRFAEDIAAKIAELTRGQPLMRSVLRSLFRTH